MEIALTFALSDNLEMACLVAAVALFVIAIRRH